MDNKLTQAHYDWAASFCGIPDLSLTDDVSDDQAIATTDSGAPGSVGGSVANAAPANAAPANAAGDLDAPALPPTDSTVFFDRNSATLKPDQQKALQVYVDAYVAAATPTRVTLNGYASMEGDKGLNMKLAKQRADAVKTFMATTIKPALIDTVPNGPTAQFQNGLPAANRRVDFGPPVKAASPSAPGGGSGGGNQPGDGTTSPPSQPKGEVQEKHPLSKQDPVPVRSDSGSGSGSGSGDTKKPHPGVDVSGAGGSSWSLQATLLLKDFDLKRFNGKKVSLDLFHEPNLSLTLDSNAGLTAQEAVSILNLHWIPPWKKEVEVPLNLFVNEALTNSPGKVTGGGQIQVEQHIVKWFSITVNVTGTIDNGLIWSAGGGVLFHIKG